MSDPLTLVVFSRAKPGKEEELGERLLALVEPSRAEEGCISYDMHQSKDDPAVWMAYENWRSEDDLALHFEQPYLKLSPPFRTISWPNRLIFGNSR